jgi:hypothetical protein
MYGVAAYRVRYRTTDGQPTNADRSCWSVRDSPPSRPIFQGSTAAMALGRTLDAAGSDPDPCGSWSSSL